MFLFYVDESGTSDLNDNSTHFVLGGLAIPSCRWNTCENDISAIKKKYSLENTEIHTAWILRDYHEQSKIPDFAKLPLIQRRAQIETYRKSHLHKLQIDPKKSKSYKQIKKNYEHTQAYIHLTLLERQKYIKELATTIGKWNFARLFAECIDKIFWKPALASQSIDEQSFEQIVSRYEKFLGLLNGKKKYDERCFGIIIHDNNETVSKKHTLLMKNFYQKGTLWTQVENIIEAPLFVNSELTSMVQIADLCVYSIRRYLEQSEDELFNEIFKRAHRRGKTVVGVRHFSEPHCKCIICKNHSK